MSIDEPTPPFIDFTKYPDKYHQYKLAWARNDIGNAHRYKVESNGDGFYLNDKGKWVIICNKFTIEIIEENNQITEMIKYHRTTEAKLISFSGQIKLDF